VSAVCRPFLSAALASASPAVREAITGAAVLGDNCTGYTVELRDGEQIEVGRACCKYCARTEALWKLAGKLDPEES
jgi:hypothetical protein